MILALYLLMVTLCYASVAVSSPDAAATTLPPLFVLAVVAPVVVVRMRHDQDHDRAP